MRAREPDADGFVDRGGVKLHWEVFGDGEPTLLLLPTWTIIHARFWKAQIPYLARHFRVVTYDGPGNGRSDRPLDPGALRLRGRRRGRRPRCWTPPAPSGRWLVSLSMGAQWALWLMAHHPERVLGSVFIGPRIDLGRRRTATSRTAFDEPYTSTEGWAKYNRHYWLDHYQDFLEFFFSQCFSEPHSTKQVEDAVGWGLETLPGGPDRPSTPAPSPTRRPSRDWCARSTPPGAGHPRGRRPDQPAPQFGAGAGRGHRRHAGRPRRAPATSPTPATRSR